MFKITHVRVYTYYRYLHVSIPRIIFMRLLLQLITYNFSFNLLIYLSSDTLQIPGPGILSQEQRVWLSEPWGSSWVCYMQTQIPPGKCWKNHSCAIIFWLTVLVLLVSQTDWICWFLFFYFFICCWFTAGFAFKNMLYTA